jgi:hypothetical protein
MRTCKRLRTRVLALTAIICVTIAQVTTPPSPVAARTWMPGYFFVIKNGTNTKCLTAKEFFEAVTLRACKGGPDQMWTYDEYGRLASGLTGQCLDVHWPDWQTDGGRVQLWGCHAGPNQRWNEIGNQWRSRGGLCLDVHAPDINNNGAYIQVWGCWEGQNQRWIAGSGYLGERYGGNPIYVTKDRCSKNVEFKPDPNIGSEWLGGEGATLRFPITENPISNFETGVVWYCGGSRERTPCPRATNEVRVTREVGRRFRVECFISGWRAVIFPVLS